MVKKIAGTASMASGSTAKCWYFRLTQIHSTPHATDGAYRESALCREFARGEVQNARYGERGYRADWHVFVRVKTQLRQCGGVGLLRTVCTWARADCFWRV